jgi:outer membrane protein OmpA-like peptidoglycan-associated protein
VKSGALLILLLFLIPFSGLRADTLFSAEINADPLSFDTAENGYGIESGASLFFGYTDMLYTAGFHASLDAAFYDLSRINENADGSWFYTKFLFRQSYLLSKSGKEPHTAPWAANWSCGLAWFHNTISGGTIDYYGLCFDGSIEFPLPIRFLSGEIINNVDLLYSFDSGFSLQGMAPHYKGEIRIFFDPGVRPFLFFLELKVIYHTIGISETSHNTFFISSGAGVKFILYAGGKSKQEKTTIENRTISTATEEEPVVDTDLVDEGEKSIDPDIEKLLISETGTKIPFYSIRFISYSEIIVSESYPVLDRIAGVLLTRTSIGISISAYAEYREDPVSEFNLYINRAKRIKEYLVSKGIDEKRLRISSIGQIVTGTAGEKNAGVILEIFSVE